MAEELTKKQEGFAKEYLDTGNATQAALNNYDTTDYSTAGNIGSENLKKPKVRQYLEENAQGAASRVVSLSISAENEGVRLSANKDILDRSGYKPIEQTDITSKGEKITSSVLPEVIAEADRLLKAKKLEVKHE